jgi:hypothetical protein
VKAALSYAFSKWKAVSTFKFEESLDQFDIVIEFGDFVEMANQYRPAARQAAQNAKNKGKVLAMTMTTAQSTQEINTLPYRLYLTITVIGLFPL